jgi:hypothetical protein
MGLTGLTGNIAVREWINGQVINIDGGTVLR